MRRIGKVFLLGVVVGLVIAALRALRDGGRPSSVPALTPAPAALPDPAVTPPVPAVPVATPPLPPQVVDDGDGAVTWVAPVDGACPEGFPVKVKVSSGIFHQPGGLSYARTRPDRCYATAAAAEADGYRPALR